MSLSRAQARLIDQRCLEEFDIPGIVLMENAARGVADAAVEELAASGRTTGRVLIVCGGGNNGGDGLAAARHLHNRGHDVHVALTLPPAKYQGDALINWRIVEAMRLPTLHATSANLARFACDVVVDAIFGTGLSAPPREPFPQIVAAIEQIGCTILAVDLPSGLDCDTGQPLSVAIHATRTVTFVAEKIGFANPAARQYLGKLSVADIGCPREIVPRD